MKKFFTLVAAVGLTLSAYAVELTVGAHSGILLPNGNVLFNLNDPEAEQWEEVEIKGLCTISSDEAVEAKTTLTLESGVEKYGFCFDQCYPVTVGSSISHTTTIAPGSPEMISVEPLMFDDGPWETSEIRTYVADVKVNATSDGSLLKQFKILISNDPDASLRAIGVDNNHFTINGNYISWNLTSAPGVMNIYTVDGRLVDQQSLSGLSGSRQLLLPAGLYIWATNSASGKIYIRR